MLPVETILAVFPSSVSVGNITMRPMTLYHVVALEYYGIDTTVSLDAGNAYAAAWILSKSPEEIREMMECDKPDTTQLNEWMECCGASVSQVVKAVNRVINTAYKTNVPGASISGESYRKGPSGYGWPLEIAEAVCHEYSIPFEEAMSIPLVRVFGMMASARIRNGGKAGGPDYYERIVLTNMTSERKV